MMLPHFSAFSLPNLPLFTSFKLSKPLENQSFIAPSLRFRGDVFYGWPLNKKAIKDIEKQHWLTLKQTNSENGKVTMTNAQEIIVNSHPQRP